MFLNKSKDGWNRKSDVFVKKTQHFTTGNRKTSKVRMDVIKALRNTFLNGMHNKIQCKVITSIVAT